MAVVHTTWTLPDGADAFATAWWCVVWDQPVDGESPAPGFGLAWSARPVRAVQVDARALGVELPAWTDTSLLDPQLGDALGLPRPPGAAQPEGDPPDGGAADQP